MKPSATIAVLLAAISGSVGPWAAVGHIPIYQPTTISAPGHYVLTRDITATSGPGLRIQASNVTVDLNGWSIFSASSSLNLVQIDDGNRDITIRNGLLRGGSNGVLYVSSANRTRLALDNLDISDVANSGVFVQDAEHVEIVSCRIVNCQGGGIFVSGFSDVFSGRFVDNSIVNSLGGLTVSDLRDGEVSGNVIAVQATAARGIELTGSASQGGGNLVERNTIAIPGGSSVIGILIDSASNHNLIRENVVRGATQYGIYVFGSENRLLRNLVGKSTSDGIFVFGGARDLLDGNQVEGGSTNCGIRFINNSAHAWRNNMLRGNGAGPGICNGAGGNTNAGGNICDAGFCP